MIIIQNLSFLFSSCNLPKMGITWILNVFRESNSLLVYLIANQLTRNLWIFFLVQNVEHEVLPFKNYQGQSYLKQFLYFTREGKKRAILICFCPLYLDIVFNYNYKIWNKMSMHHIAHLSSNSLKISFIQSS